MAIGISMHDEDGWYSDYQRELRRANKAETELRDLKKNIALAYKRWLEDDEMDDLSRIANACADETEL